MLSSRFRKLKREILRRKSLVRNDQRIGVLFARADTLLIARPFVLDPSGVDVFGFASVNEHDLCRGKRRIDVRLIFLAALALQALTAEKYAIALFHQIEIKFSEIVAINGMLASVFLFFLVTVLEADEDIVGLFSACLFEPFTADALHIVCVILENGAGFRVGKLHGLAVIVGFVNAIDRRRITGGYISAVVVLLIFDAVA